MPSPETSAGNLLLVEGRDDKQVVRRLCENSGQVQSFRTEGKGGIQELLRSIEAHLQEPDLRALGIVVDANTNPVGRWQSLATRISRAGIEVPGELDRDGTIIEGEIRIGVWLMPDNRSPGELEDFFRKMIRHDDAIWPRAESYIEDIPTEHRRFAPGKVTRAKVHAWLAAQERPHPMGLSIQAGHLDASEPTVQKFVAWLKRCFGPSHPDSE